MHPKPAPKEKKLPKPLRRTRVVTRRKKARPGRLKGEEMSEFRAETFQRERGMCMYCKLLCGARDWDLAHIRNRRMFGDNTGNVGIAHKLCHRRYHTYGPSGIKPCPPK